MTVFYAMKRNTSLVGIILTAIRPDGKKINILKNK